MNFWLIILGMGLVTYAVRVLPIFVLERYPLPPRLQAALRLVPIAVLSAIILPEMMRPAGVVDVSLDNPRWWAGLAAIGVAYFSRNVLVTIAAGMALLWLLSSLGGL